MTVEDPRFERVSGCERLWMLSLTWNRLPLRLFLIHYPSPAQVDSAADAWILVDVGAAEHSHTLHAALEHAYKTWMQGGLLTHIIITHGHVDHVGGLATFYERCMNYGDKQDDKSQRRPQYISPQKQQLPELIVHADEYDFIFKLSHTSLASSSTNRFFRAVVALRMFQDVSTEERRRLDDMNIPCLRISSLPDSVMCNAPDGMLNDAIHILHTPGHTPGHISIYVQTDQVLLAGDALLYVKLCPFTRVTLWADFPLSSYDRPLARASIHRTLSCWLRERGCQFILPSHDSSAPGTLTLDVVSHQM